MLNAGWISRSLFSRRIMVFGDTDAAAAIARGAGRISRHEISFLRTQDMRDAGCIVIDAGDETATLVEARRAAGSLSGSGIIGVVLESWSGFTAALALDAELDGVRVRPLCAPARLARSVLAEHPWSRLSHSSGPSTAVIRGTGALAEHLVVALFRSMHLAQQRPQVIVAGDGATAWVAALHRKIPQLAGIGSLNGANTAAGAGRVCAVYVVEAGGDVAALPAAVPQYWFINDAPPGAVRIAPFDWRLAARDLFEDRQDARARAIHSFYYEQALRDGNAPGSRPSMMPWETLPERFRQASRYQADHVPIKLMMTGCRETASAGGKFRFTKEEVEVLARVEHERWSAVQLLDGWRYGEKRDDAARLTPFLKPYDELSPEIQDRDRMPVRQIQAQSARIGHGVRRDVVMIMSAEVDAEPGWAFATHFAMLLRDIAARYPGRQLMLATRLATALERSAAKIATDKKLALLCLLLASEETPAEIREFIPRAAKLLVTDDAAVVGELRIHIGGNAPKGARRLVLMAPSGAIEAAPWI